MGAMSYVSSYYHCIFIQTQEEHHRKMTFHEELLALLKRHRIAYDERYLWE